MVEYGLMFWLLAFSSYFKDSAGAVRGCAGMEHQQHIHKDPFCPTSHVNDVFIRVSLLTLVISTVHTESLFGSAPSGSTCQLSITCMLLYLTKSTACILQNKNVNGDLHHTHPVREVEVLPLLVLEVLDSLTPPVKTGVSIKYYRR